MQRTSKPPIMYNVIIEVDDRNITVDWGNAEGWMDVYKDEISKAHRISLIPKGKGPYPFVSVFLDGDKRPVIGSRVHGSMTDGSGVEFRIYFIGWQRTIEKQVYAEDGRPFTDKDKPNPNQQENVKSVHWVYPGGAVECSPEPTMVEKFMQHFKKQAGMV